MGKIKMKVKNFLETLNHGDLKNLKNKLTDLVESNDGMAPTARTSKKNKRNSKRRSKNKNKKSPTKQPIYDAEDQRYDDVEDTIPAKKLDMQDAVDGIWDYRFHI